MASLSIQFHATIDELANFVETWLADESIGAAAVEYQPFTAFSVTREDVREVLTKRHVRRIVFVEGIPNCDASGNMQMLDNNADALLLDIGRLGPRGLDESRLSATNAKVAWKSAAALLKRESRAGAIGVHHETGASAHYRNHRITHGARTLWEQGTALRQFAQSSVVLRPDDEFVG